MILKRLLGEILRALCVDSLAVITAFNLFDN